MSYRKHMSDFIASSIEEEAKVLVLWIDKNGSEGTVSSQHGLDCLSLKKQDHTAHLFDDMRQKT